MKKCLLPLFAVLAFCGGMLSCGGSGAAGAAKDSDSVQIHPLPDTLRVVTLYSPTSYFIYRDEPMGYDYSLVSALAAEKGMKLEIEVAPSLAAAVDMLEDGRADLLASRVPVTDEYVRRAPLWSGNLYKPSAGSAPHAGRFAGEGRDAAARTHRVGGRPLEIRATHESPQSGTWR